MVTKNILTSKQILNIAETAGFIIAYRQAREGVRGNRRFPLKLILLFLLRLSVFNQSIDITMSTHTRSEYMQWVTNNADQMVKNETNTVACVYCRNVYDAVRLSQICKCLVCNLCGIDAVMVVKHSPLQGLPEEEQAKLLLKWHAQGFIREKQE
jgi:hypothetical protein